MNYTIKPEALRKLWSDRIERKRVSARNFAAGGEYSIAARMAAEAEATELCLKEFDRLKFTGCHEGEAFDRSQPVTQ